MPAGNGKVNNGTELQEGVRIRVTTKNALRASAVQARSRSQGWLGLAPGWLNPGRRSACATPFTAGNGHLPPHQPLYQERKCAMKFQSLEDVFLTELRDLLSAEHQITRALPKMV